MTLAMDERSFLLLHGWQNRRPAHHWQRWLAERLSEEGAQVLYPQLPDPDDPALEDWLVDLRHYAAAMRGGEKVLICHSLAVLLWWSAVASDEPVEADRVLLVAPPSPAFLREQPVAEFVPADMATGLDAELRSSVRLVASDADPYCPGGALTEYANRYGLVADIVQGAGHMDPAAGYGDWPSVLEWCRDPSVRITGRKG